MHMFYDNGYMIGMHALWWLFWAGLIVILIWSGWFRSGKPDAALESPQEILRRRLASGDITPAEYEEPECDSTVLTKSQFTGLQHLSRTVRIMATSGATTARSKVPSGWLP